jgi:hypothetical protein
MSLEKLCANQVVTYESHSFFSEKNPHAAKYSQMETHDMKESINLARHLAWQLLSLRFHFIKQVNTLTTKNIIKYDTDISAPMMANHSHRKKIPDMKIMGALIHPLFQSKPRMIDARLCTRSQYDAGYDELIDRTAQHIEDETSNHITRTFDQGPVKTNHLDSADLAEIDNNPRAKTEN